MRLLLVVALCYIAEVASVDPRVYDEETYFDSSESVDYSHYYRIVAPPKYHYFYQHVLPQFQYKFYHEQQIHPEVQYKYYHQQGQPQALDGYEEGSRSDEIGEDEDDESLVAPEVEPHVYPQTRPAFPDQGHVHGEAPCLEGHTDPLLIHTTRGPVRGFFELTATQVTVRSWFGIPFAAKPLGDLRYVPPTDHELWNDVMEVTTRPNSCVQNMDYFFGDFHGTDVWNANTNRSEDCLYLSITAPDPPEKLTPVLVWIHGGGFYSGTTTQDRFRREVLAAEERIIVVGIQYRVGPQGFMNLGIDEVPGNMGLMDQAFGLKWIHDNIERFGGDPNKVTIMGESAGSMSVGLHLMSQLSRPYFRRAIMESGGPLSMFNDPEYVKEKSLELAAKAGCQCSDCDNDDHIREVVLTCLQDIKPEKILELSTELGSPYAFFPTVDNTTFLLKNPREILENKEFYNVDLLIGTDKNEVTYAFLYYLPNIFKLQDHIWVGEEEFKETIPVLFPGFSNRSLEAMDFNYAPWDDRDNTEKNIIALDQMLGDQFITCPMLEIAREYASVGNIVYYFYFTHRFSTHPWPKWVGAMHADELRFIFGRPLEPEKGYTKEEMLLSKRMMRYWGNFVRTGNPNVNPSGTWMTPNWPIHTLRDREYLEINAKYMVVREHLRRRSCAFWEHYIPMLEKQSYDLQIRLENCPTSSGGVPPP